MGTPLVTFFVFFIFWGSPFPESSSALGKAASDSWFPGGLAAGFGLLGPGLVGKVGFMFLLYWWILANISSLLMVLYLLSSELATDSKTSATELLRPRELLE